MVYRSKSYYKNHRDEYRKYILEKEKERKEKNTNYDLEDTFNRYRKEELIFEEYKNKYLQTKIINFAKRRKLRNKIRNQKIVLRKMNEEIDSLQNTLIKR